MDNPGVLIILVAIVLIVLAVWMNRKRQQLAEETGIDLPSRRRGAPAPAPAVVADPTVPRPRVADLTVTGREAHVTFDVPFPEDGDDVLADLLVQEAVEVMREKRHTLPLEMVERVVVFAGRGDRYEVGSHKLDTPGSLPPKMEMPSMLNISRYARDPLEVAEEEGFEAPDLATTDRGDELAPLGDEIRLPKAIETGLRAQGIDPDSMGAIELVTGMLRLLGYEVAPGSRLGTFNAVKGGVRTFISGLPHLEGEHPEIDERDVDRFVSEFSMSGADRGLFVSEKYAPFGIYERERRDSRIRFVSRERLQQMVDATALS